MVKFISAEQSRRTSISFERSWETGEFESGYNELFCTMLYNTQKEACYIYIILCKDSCFYTGLHDDLIKRFEEHVNAIYETCYTFKKRPLE